jgi:hypothetical protein
LKALNPNPAPLMKIRQLLYPLALGLLAACSPKTEYAIEPKDLSRFHGQYVAQAEARPASDSIAVYIDYSKGMHEGIMASADFIRELFTMANTPRTVYYRVGTADRPPRIDINATANIPWNLNNYNDTRSVLDEPVRQITGGNGTAVFITDFELVKGNQELQIVQNGKTFKTSIDISSWAVNEFQNWLKGGNAIDVFAKPFTKQNAWVPQSQSQHVYTLIFTPKALTDSPDALVNRLLERGYGNKGDLKHYRFSAEEVALRAAYQDKANVGGATDNAVPEVVQVEFPLFDYYLFRQKDLMKIPEYSPNDTRFLRNLFLENAPVNYPGLKLSLNAYDITAEYTEYYNLLNPVEGEAKKKYAYHQPPAAGDVFELAYDAKKKEVGVQLHPNFTGVDRQTLYKADVVIDEARPQFDPALMEALQWTDARGFQVPSLVASLTEALSRINLKDRVVYTYYVELY